MDKFMEATHALDAAKADYEAKKAAYATAFAAAIDAIDAIYAIDAYEAALDARDAAKAAFFAAKDALAAAEAAAKPQPKGIIWDESSDECVCTYCKVCRGE